MCVSTSASSKSQISQTAIWKKSTWKSWKKTNLSSFPKHPYTLTRNENQSQPLPCYFPIARTLGVREFQIRLPQPTVRVEGFGMFWMYFFRSSRRDGFGDFRMLCDEMFRGNLLRFLFWTKIFSLKLYKLWNENCFLAKSWRIPPIKKEQLLEFLLHFELGNKKWGHLCSHHARCHCLCEEWSRVGCWRGAFFFGGFHIEGVHMFSPPKRGRGIFIITQVVVSFFKYIYFHPEPWVNDPNSQAYFSDGMKPSTKGILLGKNNHDYFIRGHSSTFMLHWFSSAGP